ncbi:hypothetical protein KVV02_006397, partial [Mortierella alpina]
STRPINPAILSVQVQSHTRSSPAHSVWAARDSIPSLFQTLSTRSHTMHILTRAEEEYLFKTLKANALKECDPVVKEFVECTQGKLFSVLWGCRKQHKAMNQCLMALYVYRLELQIIFFWTTQSDMDKLKIQYLNDLAEGRVDHAKLQREQKLKEEELKKKSKSNGPGVH